MSCQLTTGIEMSTLKYTNMLSLKIKARQTTRSWTVKHRGPHSVSRDQSEWKRMHM